MAKQESETGVVRTWDIAKQGPNRPASVENLVRAWLKWLWDGNNEEDTNSSKKTLEANTRCKIGLRCVDHVSALPQLQMAGLNPV
jgi:hypothetical protein